MLGESRTLLKYTNIKFICSEIHELYTSGGWKSLKNATAEENLISIPYKWEHKKYAYI